VLNVPIKVNLNAGDVYAVPTGMAVSQGPFFWARNPGAWSSLVSVAVTPTRRRAVAITAANTPTEIQVASTSGFYVGAIVEIDNTQQQTYAVVANIGAGTLRLTQPLGVSVSPTATARVTEIDITITDSSPAVPVTETYSGLTWNPDPNPSVRARHYSTVINAQSNLVYVQPPGVGAVNGTPFGGSETATIASQPATFNGVAVSISSANSAIVAGEAALNAVSAAVQNLENDLASLAGAALPLTAASDLLKQMKTDQDALSTAVAAATAIAVPSYGPAVGLGDAIKKVKTEADAAAATVASAIAIAKTNPSPANAVATLTSDHDSVKGNATNITAAIKAAAPTDVVSGSDATSSITDDDYVGVDNGPGHRSGIQSLQDADNISIIAAPGRTAETVQNELIDQCELLRYRFAVLDGEQDPAGGSVNAILNHRDNYDSSYAAYYAPWIAITLNNQNLFLPPSGHIAGVYAGTDNDRGVWKAPANVVVQNITGLKYYFTKGEQDILNPAGVNLIRRFTATGTRVWGARTISSDSSLKYVNVRRTLIFLEASIDHGTQWVVFEPNAPDTWDRLTDSVTAFLKTQWYNGALFGAKPEDSFFVRCDETIMTADDIQNGRLICHIGVAIVRPAEFVIFRIEQITGYANQ
jgi:phage tail sheath protein FI